METTYGRNRQSIADLEQELYDIFEEHPGSHPNEENEPVIPANALVDVLRAFSQNHDAVELMSKAEEDQLIQLIESNPGLAVTPQVLLQFIAMRTTFETRHSPEGSPPRDEDDFDGRGRSEDRDEYDDEYTGNSRSSSRDSSGTSVYRPSSRGPPQTPTNRESPFDAARRQRSTPLAKKEAAPSSWTRRPPPSRRKSDASSHSRTLSDSESSTSGRAPGRSRAPSNPTSPVGYGSPPSGASISRPHSRAQSQPYVSLGGAMNDYHYGSSPERDLPSGHSHGNPTGLMSPPASDADLSFDDESRFVDSISSLPMPRQSGSDIDSDEEGEDSSLGLVMDRSSAASSTVSLDMQERLEALQRMNTDLGRKLVDAERTLQNKLAEHEVELEEMQGRLEEVRSELSATKREEKELRSKERQNSTQISALESEIAKLQKSLDTARISYQSLQKQYQEQCAESERYRNTLRRRDQEIKDFQEVAALQSIEGTKWAREQTNYEERIVFLEGELAVAQQAHVQLDEQKQENMMLKETIDRMRFDMDEMRNNASSAHQPAGGSGPSSAHGSMSKSLGAELLSKMRNGWGMDDVDKVEEAEVSTQLADMEPVEDEDTEGEDIVQTIITRTKRKVPSRAKTFEQVKVDEVKEYSDTATQYDSSEFTSDGAMQTDPEPKILTASFNIQTDEIPLTTMSIQTDPEPAPEPIRAPLTTNVQIQTDELPEPSTSQLLEDDEETLASSSSTLLPPTPKAQHEHLHAHDLPPAYNQVTNADRDELAVRIANETLKKWHKGLQLPIEPVAGGISDDAIEDWKALKEELGVECTAIDRLVDESVKTGLPRPPRDGPARRRKSSRFYNIYNTYVYGDPDGGQLVSSGQLFFCIGASAAVAFLVGHAMAPQYVIPGGATYYDRAAWTSFNSMQAAGEGFAGDTAAVWGFLGRLGGGAARTLRGWPT